MVEGLLDTSILVDIQRNYAPTMDWLASQSTILGITRFVWFEIIEGCSNKAELSRSIKLLESFSLVSFTEQDLEWAIKALIRTNLSHNIDVFDCLIASASIRLQIPLFTRNIKHFELLIDDFAREPFKSR